MEMLFWCCACDQDIISIHSYMWDTLQDALDGTLKNTWCWRHSKRQAFVPVETPVSIDGHECSLGSLHGRVLLGVVIQGNLLISMEEIEFSKGLTTWQWGEHVLNQSLVEGIGVGLSNLIHSELLVTTDSHRAVLLDYRNDGGSPVGELHRLKHILLF